MMLRTIGFSLLAGLSWQALAQEARCPEPACAAVAGGRPGERRLAEGAAGRRRARSSSCRGPPLEENAAVDGVLQGTAVAVLHHEPGLGQNPRCGLALRRG